MRKRAITVGGAELHIPYPENMDELRERVDSEEDLFQVALRGWDQTFRTYLLNRKKAGDSKAELIRRARRYVYRTQQR